MSEQYPELSVLGRQINEPQLQVETFAAPAGVTHVTLETDELQAFCPVTHQPDFYHIAISYVPRGRCIESKSLKLYLQHFRDEALFAETLAAMIAHDLWTQCQAATVRVVLTQNVRGGIVTTVEAQAGDGSG